FESTQRLGLGRAMTISMSYPVVAASLAALLLGERLTAPIVVGGLLTLAGVVLIVMARVELPGEPRPWRGVVDALLAAVAWGVSVVALRVPLDEIDPVSAQAVRLPVGALLLWVTPWALRGLPGLLRGGWPLFGRLLALAALTAVSSVMYGASVKYAGVAVAAVLSSTAPLFAVPLGIVFLGERLPLLAMIAAAARCHRDRRDVGAPRQRANTLDQPEGVLALSAEIDEEDVGPDAFERPEGAPGGGGGADQGRRVLQDGFHELAGLRVVDDQEDVNAAKRRLLLEALLRHVPHQARKNYCKGFASECRSDGRGRNRRA